MEAMLAAILEDDRAAIRKLLKGDRGLVAREVTEPRMYDAKILHWLYAGDTALHLAAAGHRAEIVRLLLDAGANPNSRKNHRQSGPLHYAADGYINSPNWSPEQQVETIECLLDAGALINSQDKNGAAPLPRAVRTRCAAAVRCLLERGADANLRNKSGSTVFHLAVQNTGRGGSGAEVARAAQEKIIRELLDYGLKPSLKDGRGKSVLDSVRSEWIRKVLNE